MAISSGSNHPVFADMAQSLVTSTYNLSLSIQLINLFAVCPHLLFHSADYHIIVHVLSLFKIHYLLQPYFLDLYVLIQTAFPSVPFLYAKFLTGQFSAFNTVGNLLESDIHCTIGATVFRFDVN